MFGVRRREQESVFIPLLMGPHADLQERALVMAVHEAATMKEAATFPAHRVTTPDWAEEVKDS